MPKRLPITNYSLFLDMLVDGIIPALKEMQSTPGRLPRAPRVCATIPSLTRPGNMLRLAECHPGRWSWLLIFSVTVPDFCSTNSMPLSHVAFWRKSGLLLETPFCLLPSFLVFVFFFFYPLLSLQTWLTNSTWCFFWTTCPVVMWFLEGFSYTGTVAMWLQIELDKFYIVAD